jgi:hypothetical protein
VVEQLPGYASYARPTGITPLIDSLADPVDRFQFLYPSGVVAGVIKLIGGRPATLNYPSNPTIIVLRPVLVGLVIR